MFPCPVHFHSLLFLLRMLLWSSVNNESQSANSFIMNVRYVNALLNFYEFRIIITPSWYLCSINHVTPFHMPLFVVDMYTSFAWKKQSMLTNPSCHYQAY
ncbi:hypothetical protein M426DRAFT_97492 [Hypoxylon sp. CI-4A]|nr:hypothetical protein M426DRAFT_97492 [Hypoxylon sp. CI-4A]